MLTAAQIMTPLGPATLAANGDVLCGLIFSDGWSRLRDQLARRFGPQALPLEPGASVGPALEGVAARVSSYFKGELDALDHLPVDVQGTPFQNRVWTALRTIRTGEVISYTELARRVGAPRAVRAVGSANGQNPISLVIPCHRVVQKDGSLGGYGGGVDRKRWLLEHEAGRPSAIKGHGSVADDGSVLIVDRLLVMEQLPLHA